MRRYSKVGDRAQLGRPSLDPRLLRNGDTGVRICAARAFNELEWTAGIPDLQAAVDIESDAVVQADLTLSLSRLKAMAPSVAERGGQAGRREVAVTIDDLPW